MYHRFEASISCVNDTCWHPKIFWKLLHSFKIKIVSYSPLIHYSRLDWLLLLWKMFHSLFNFKLSLLSQLFIIFVGLLYRWSFELTCTLPLKYWIIFYHLQRIQRFLPPFTDTRCLHWWGSTREMLGYRLEKVCRSAQSAFKCGLIDVFFWG